MTYYPPQNNPNQPGYTGYTGQMPPQTGYTGQMPPQTGYAGQAPQGGYTGYTGQMPPQTGYTGQVPPQTGYTGQMPPADAMGQPTQEAGRFGYVPMDDDPRSAPMPLWQKVLIAAVIVFVGVYAYVSLKPDTAHYALIGAYSMGERHSGESLLARDEVPYDAEGVTNVRYVAPEGSLVSRNTPICTVFSSGYSTREMTALQDYRDQIRDYQKTLLSNESTYDARMARAESDVLTRSKEVREMIAGARGSLTNQETLLTEAIRSRQQYLKQKYASDQRLARLYDDEQAQTQKIDSWTKNYASQWEAYVSFYSDGYEYSLTAENYDQFRPQEVRRMIGGEKPDSGVSLKGRMTIYRLVRENTWYVLLLADDTDWNPLRDKTYTLRLDGEDIDYTATVVSFEHSGGELLVRLAVDGNVSSVISKRVCRAELYDDASTLVVPPRAIYKQDGMEGVVVVSDGYQSFVPISILRRDGDNVFIAPIDQGLLFEGMTVRLF